MKLFQYDRKTHRLYIGRPIMLTLIISTITFLGLFIFWVIFVYAFFHTQYASGSNNLGVVPQELQKSTNDPEQAAQMLARKKESQYGNTLNIIFFLDGYKGSKEGLAYTDILTSSMKKDPYFKKLIPLTSTIILTSEGNKCWVENKKLVCDKRTYDAFGGLGIPHIKIVLLSPLDFQPSAEETLGKDSFITVSTAKESMGTDFINGLKKSISMDLQPAFRQEQYLHGVLYCFYGGKESYLWDGNFNSCSDFMNGYPKFWED